MTIAELKRKLQVGTALKMTFNSIGHTSKLNIIRFIVKVQGNGVYLNEDKEETKGSFLEFPKSSLMELSQTGFKTFRAGFRDFTEEETKIIKNEPKDEEQQKIDLMTDGSQMFYRRKRYYKECGFEYLSSQSKPIKGLYRMNEKIRDEGLKGDLDLEYEFVD